MERTPQKSMFSRAKSFGERLRMLTRAIGPIRAVSVLLQVKRKPDVIHSMRYKGNKVHFRKSDLQALLEVLGNEEYSFLRKEIQGKGPIVVLDVGGHIGSFAIWTLGINPEAHVISIEPDPDTFAVLARNVEEMSVKKFRWEAIQAAASKQDGQVLRFSTSGPSMSHRLDVQGKIEVRGIDLTKLVNQPTILGRDIDVLKVDIEGAEVDFLTSNPNALKKVNCVAVELHPYLAPSDQIEGVLEERYENIGVFYGQHSNKPLLLAKDAGQKREQKV